jgi:type II secretory pathway pseudopilin PulG
MVLVEVLIFLSVLILALIAGTGWWTERQRRIRNQNALQSVEHIQDLATEVYETRDKGQCDTVNQLIDAWNAEFSADMGYTMPNINCAAL